MYVDDAGLDRSLVKELRNNVPGECNLVDYIIPCIHIKSA